MAEPTIRRADAADREIGDFIHDSFTDYGEKSNVTLNFDEFCFAAEDDGTLAGAITGRAYYNEVHIGDLIVRESARRSGVGSRLVKAVEDAYRGKGYDFVTLTTFAFQAPEFYKKLGYEVEFIRESRDKRLNKIFFKKAL